MSLLLSIDPGLRGCAFATWRDGVLQDAAYAPASVSRRITDLPTLWRQTAIALFDVLCRSPDFSVQGCDLAIELPQVYQQARRGGKDPNDLIALAGVVGYVVTGRVWKSAAVVRPFAWKGQVPKPVTEARACATLTPSELARVRLPTAKKHQTDVWDAVGIGLWYLDR